MIKWLAVALLFGVALAADLSPYLPDNSKTPGLLDPVLTKELICRPEFRTGKYRDVDDDTKDTVCQAYGLPPHCNAKQAFEIDHLCAIYIGGSQSTANLWPQTCSGEWNCHVKDKLEVYLHEQLCSGKIASPQEACDCLRNDWIACYKRYFDKPVPLGGKLHVQ